MGIRLIALLGAAFVALALAAPALATEVTLRVEGKTETLFEGPVETRPHAIDGQPCDGTNAGANPEPGPTMTGALDDSGLAWSGTWFQSFEDFLIEEIEGEANDLGENRFWGLVLNFAPAPVGGCQQQVEEGDEVVFAYDLFSKEHILRLSQDRERVTLGQEVTFTVLDGQDGSPLADATVAGKTTDEAGQAAVSYAAPGTYTEKAERDDSIRSNAVTVCVYDPAKGGCGIAPPAPPRPSPSPTPPPPEPPPEPEVPSEEPESSAQLTTPSCYDLAVQPRSLAVGERAVLRIEVRANGEPIVGAGLAIRGDGIKVRAETDGQESAHVTLRPKHPGRLHIAVRGQKRRCGATTIAVPGPRPAAAPRRIPAWAWQLHAWHLTPPGERGSRPHAAPRRVPDWYWEWRRWRMLRAV